MIELRGYRKYISAGKIASKVREKSREIAEEGMPILELCEKIESEIVKLGGKPAFPLNVGINDVAAHYTSPPEDTSILPKNSLVKIDLGVHVDGYIADTAITISLHPKYSLLVETAEQALKEACSRIKPKMKASEIGKIIQKVIEDKGLKPVWNLHGHKITRFTTHAGKIVPNVYFIDGTKVRAGEVYAIEPFVTLKEAAGEVIELPEAYIYRYVRNVSMKDTDARLLLEKIRTEYRTLPFALRWIEGFLPRENLKRALAKLISVRAIMVYPVLLERSKRVVAQAEHTVIITDEGTMTIT
jgi:methionyl aminopeptidase